MQQIPLTQGKFASVDDQDYEFLSQWKWYAQKIYNTFYAVRKLTKYLNQKQLYMHRIIAERMHSNIEQKHIDHKNRNGLDNQRDNLRVVTRSQNKANSRKYKNNKSGYKGVSWNKQHNKWQAQIRANGKQIHLGYFGRKLDAARAYDKAASKYFGEFAVLNNA